MLKRLMERFRILKDRSGTAAVEFAIVAPTFILIILGGMDLGRAMMISSTIEHVASDGARYAAVRGSEKEFPATEAEVEAYVKSKSTGLDTNQLDVDVSWAPNDSEGGLVTVEVSYPYTFLVAGILSLGPIEIENVAIMVINRPPGVASYVRRPNRNHSRRAKPSSPLAGGPARGLNLTTFKHMGAY